MILITSCAAQPPANQTIEMYKILFPSWVVAIYLWKPTLHATRCRHSGRSRVAHHHWGSHAVLGRWAFCWRCSWGGQCPVQQHIRLECCRTRLGNAHRLGGQSCRRSECPAVRCPPLQECKTYNARLKTLGHYLPSGSRRQLFSYSSAMREPRSTAKPAASRQSRRTVRSSMLSAGNDSSLR